MHDLAQHGNKNAQFHLGNSYVEGKGVQQNHELAKEWFEKQEHMKQLSN